MSDQPSDNNGLLNFLVATVETIRDQMVTKSDLEGLATKSDIARLESKMEAEFVAVRGDIEQVHLRLDSIDKALTTRTDKMETEISRLRSVVYLLVKDKPDMLRLLGQPPSAGD